MSVSGKNSSLDITEQFPTVYGMFNREHRKEFNYQTFIENLANSVVVSLKKNYDDSDVREAIKNKIQSKLDIIEQNHEDILLNSDFKGIGLSKIVYNHEMINEIPFVFLAKEAVFASCLDVILIDYPHVIDGELRDLANENYDSLCYSLLCEFMANAETPEKNELSKFDILHGDYVVKYLDDSRVYQYELTPKAKALLDKYEKN